MAAVKRMKVCKCPSDELSLTNCAIVNPVEFPDYVKHIEVKSLSERFIFTIRRSRDMSPGSIGLCGVQRHWAVLFREQDIEVRSYIFDPNEHMLLSMSVEADFLNHKHTTAAPYEADAMAKQFLANFQHQFFTVGQKIIFAFQNKERLSLVVKDLEVIDIAAVRAGAKVKHKKSRMGLCLPNTVVTFEIAAESPLNLIKKPNRNQEHQRVFNPDWDFQKMGIGGLDHEFSTIFRRAFASRVVPPEVVEQMGGKHVKGILLYGPPGTGKTLIARQIGKMLNAHEPKIVNGPEILSKYYGESEAKIRRLFAEAEKEEKQLGSQSGLHVIIFDEIDAFCRSRGSLSDSNGYYASMVTQLLSKLDGVEQLNNILVIGMTNRKEIIDEALLRPGRLEIQIEIGLPDEAGRLQILNIHTACMRENQRLAADVDLKELASLTRNFTGAELEGLVRAAQSNALNRLIKVSSQIEIVPEYAEKMAINHSDFICALKNDIKPASESCAQILELYLNRGIINWGTSVSSILEKGMLLVDQARGPDGYGLVSILIEGPPCAGKTAIAAQLAKNSNFPVRVCRPRDMVGLTESTKLQKIRQCFDDAYSFQRSCILVDDIEGFADYGVIGPGSSNLILPALPVLLRDEPPKGRKLLVICTTSCRHALKDMLSIFTAVLHVPNISTSKELVTVLEETNVFSKEEIDTIARRMEAQRLAIGIRKLLAHTDMAKAYSGDNRVNEFISKLEEDGAFA